MTKLMKRDRESPTRSKWTEERKVNFHAGLQASKAVNTWGREEEDAARKLWEAGTPAPLVMEAINAMFGNNRTSNSVIGRMHRIGAVSGNPLKLTSNPRQRLTPAEMLLRREEIARLQAERKERNRLKDLERTRRNRAKNMKSRWADPKWRAEQTKRITDGMGRAVRKVCVAWEPPVTRPEPWHPLRDPKPAFLQRG